MVIFYSYVKLPEGIFLGVAVLYSFQSCNEMVTDPKHLCDSSWYNKSIFFTDVGMILKYPTI